MEKVNTFKMTARSDLKKYAKLNGYTVEAVSTGSFLKHISLRFKISEFVLKKAAASNKIRIYVG